MAFSYIKLHACFTIDKIFIFQRKMVRYLYTDLTVNELFTCSDQVIPSLSSAKAYVQQCSNKIIRLYLSLSIVYMQEVAVWWSVHTRRNFFFLWSKEDVFFLIKNEDGLCDLYRNTTGKKSLDVGPRREFYWAACWVTPPLRPRYEATKFVFGGPCVVCLRQVTLTHTSLSKIPSECFRQLFFW